MREVCGVGASSYRNAPPRRPQTVPGETREHLDQGLCDACSVLMDHQWDMWTPFILGLRVRVRLGSGTRGRVMSLHRTDRSHFSDHQSCRCSCALRGLVTTRQATCLFQSWGHHELSAAAHGPAGKLCWLCSGGSSLRQ